MAGLSDITIGNFTKLYYLDIDNADAETEITNVQSITHPTDEANVIDVQQYGQQYNRKLRGSSTTGNCEVVVNFNPADSSHQYLLAEYKSGRRNSFKLEVNGDIAGTSSSYIEFAGQVVSKTSAGEFDGVTTITFSISVDGALSDWTDAV